MKKNKRKISYFMSCKGVTKKGTNCSRGGKYDGYCYQHKQIAQESDTESEPEQDTCKFVLKNKLCVKAKIQGTEYCKTHKCGKIGCISFKISKSRYCGFHTDENKRILDERKRQEEQEEKRQEERYDYILYLLNTIQTYRDVIQEERPSSFIEPVIDSLVPTEAKQTCFECVVCQTNQIQTVITPCMHACYCSACAKTALAFSKDCPKCRHKVEKISPLYI